jgi:hypothetical protein
MKSKKSDPIRIVVLIAALVSIGFLIFFTILFVWYVEHPAFTTSTINPSIFGQYGDVVGGFVGTALGFVSIYLLYETYMNQKKELQETKVALQSQKMDSAFFNLLSILEQVRKDMKFPDLKRSMFEKFKSLDHKYFLTYMYEKETGKFITKLGLTHPELRKDVNRVDPEDLRRGLSDRFVRFYNENQNQLSHYFRYVFNILKYIKTSAIEDEDEERYLALFASLLSDDELALLFYNGISDLGKNLNDQFLFKEWLDEGGILTNIDPANVKFYWVTHFYPKSNFEHIEETFF